MVEKSYDAIVIGAGHNGLVAAAHLARAGYSVLVVERNERLGGATTSEDLLPGYWIDTGSFDASLFSKQIITEFGLRKHDLRFIESPVLAFAPQPAGIPLTLWRDNNRNRAEISRFSDRDASTYASFQETIFRIGEILRTIVHLPPPPLRNFPINEVPSWLRIAMDFKRLGREDMLEVLRILPMPVSDFLDEWFETPLLKSLFGSQGVSGLLLGPSAPGTTLMFLYNSLGSNSGNNPAITFVRGGMGNLANALASEAQSRGAEILVGRQVSEIIIERDQASGVRLEDGTVVRGKAILSNSNPRHTFFDLVGTKYLDVEFVRELNNIRYRGSVARLVFGLSDLPRFRSATYRESEIKEGTLLSGRIMICPDLMYIEKAYDDAKYGVPSVQPLLYIAIPTILDPSRAPKGKHLMLVDAQYAPRHPADGGWESHRLPFADRVIDLLEEHAPGFRRLIEAQVMLTPEDLETRFGLPEGCIHHGQMVLDQLFIMRPVPGYGSYRTPIDGLYLCGASAHPGGGVTGLPGYHAGRLVSKDLGAGNIRKSIRK